MRRTVEICEEMVMYGSKTVRGTIRTHYGHLMFAKATQHARSIIDLIEISHEKNRPIDVGAICFLARCIMETYNAFAYLTASRLSKDEASLRIDLFSLNHSTNLIDIHARLGIKSCSLQEWSRESSSKNIQKNPIFQALDEPHKKSLIKGKTPFLHHRFSANSFLPKKIESGLYNLFSQSAHSLSLGLSTRSEHDLTAVSRNNSCHLAIESSKAYISSFAIKYWRLRTAALKDFPKHTLKILQSNSSTEILHGRLKLINDQLPEW